VKYFFTAYCQIIFIWSLFGQIIPDFSPPVKHNIVLSGSFGELRLGHFHAGLDIKSRRGVQGDSIFSIYDGYVSRIKVEPGGYGNSLYITHPNGYTSVYAHLKSFEKEIASYTKQNQLHENCFTVDINPNRNRFTVKKGAFIGLMGNSGKSFGPHLHFEIRHTKSDLLINPITLGIKPTDTRPPIINSMLLYEYDGLMNIVHEEEIPINKRSQSVYKLVRDTLHVKSLDSFSLSIKLFDRMNGASNKNGVYQINTILNDTLISSLCFDSLRFEDSNGIAFLIDQKRMNSTRSINHLFHITAQYPFSFSKSIQKFLKKDRHVEFRIDLIDYMLNKSSIDFVISEKNKVHKKIHSNYIIAPNTASLVNTQNFSILFKRNTFQEKQGIVLYEKEFVHVDQLVHSIYFEPKYQNLNKPVEILYSPQNKIFNRQTCFSYLDKGKYKLIGNCQSDSICLAKIYNFQNVFVTTDSIPPTITPLFKNTIFRTNNSVRFIIKDNLEPTRKSQYLKINGTLNNTWVLFEYDLKTNTIAYKVDKNLKKGDYDLNLQVTDNQGNSSCYFTTIKII